MKPSIKNYLDKADNIRKLVKKYQDIEIKNISLPGFLNHDELVLSIDYSKANDFFIRDDEDPDDGDLGSVYVTLFFREENEIIIIESNSKPYLKICNGNLSCGIPKIIHNGYQQLIGESDEDYDKRSLVENFNLDELKDRLIKLNINSDLIVKILNELNELVIDD